MTTKTIIHTKEEVDNMLPLIRQIAEDIQEMWKTIIKQRSELAEKEQDPVRYADDIDPLKTELNGSIDKINQYIKEVESLGAFVEEFKRGIINFPSLVYGRKVFICIQPTKETSAEFFHELDETFADRVGLPPKERRLVR